MYSITDYHKLKSKYGLCSSWAIWNDKNESDPLIISQNYDKLHSNFVFIGLNISSSLTSEPWSNFHGGRHDRKLKYSSNDNEMRGSYITDIFKDIVEPNSSKLKGTLTDEVIKKNVKFFKKEMEDIQINSDSVFIILGSKTAHYFNKHFKQDYKNNVIYIDHYSSRGTDKEWVTGFWEKLSISQDFELTVRKYKTLVK